MARRSARGTYGSVSVAGLALFAVLFAGCSKQDPSFKPAFGGTNAKASAVARATRDAENPQVNPGPPGGLATVTVEGSSVRLWPYTGGSFDGVPSDPMNLIFVGDVDPVRIRSALMELDGDRTSYGLPNQAPFNERWGDALGDVQTSYAEPSGWTGSVIQLRLGEYAPLRVHMRLFRTTAPFGSEGGWTLGSVHFEALIPGTADHQVLSWMIARQIVTVDLMRSGLLAVPPSLTDPTTAAPSFREIPAVIYNGLPEELKALIGGPAGNAGSPVPLASDGRAAVFHLTGLPSPKAGSWTQQFSLSYDQTIPKPLCSDGPLDWVYVNGPVELTRTTTVTSTGQYSYMSRIAGRLTVTPVDVTQNPPAPSGSSYAAEVSDLQQGQTGATREAVFAQSRRIAPQRGGAELLSSSLKVASDGVLDYRVHSECLAP